MKPTFLDHSSSELDDVGCRPKVVGERELLWVTIRQDLVELSDIVGSCPKRRIGREVRLSRMKRPRSKTTRLTRTLERVDGLIRISNGGDALSVSSKVPAKERKETAFSYNQRLKGTRTRRLTRRAGTERRSCPGERGQKAHQHR